ncbi:endonuclease/exonuclease/phosphatase family protein [Oceanibacterium hippocampi]|uniref:Endonuclease/Exonuclease/phosphatase family protein n=1 Tax=Oceanibacterium hippocampi TaxID=745714 RepID=A0A1Y5RZ93_9PROT|nr:endonuclease/exonuclease/phosphatase family protein [Oceanibacterium hippocampi]SLN27585.1 Endonuclease/Exonuclease/phosphatase family protein [Oceanibacterium hippocampi]
MGGDGGGFLFASYNIHFGVGTDGRHDLDRIAATVGDADIIALQEVTRYWPGAAPVDQSQILAERLGRYHAYGAGVDVDLGETAEDDPAGGAAPDPAHCRRRTFGNMVLSRWPIRTTRNILLPKRPITGMFDLQRSALETVIDTPSGLLRVYSVHLSHVAPSQRIGQAEALMALVRQAPEEGAPWDGISPAEFRKAEPSVPVPPRRAIVMGDMNMTTDEPAYELICGGLYRGRRHAHYDQLHDAWSLAGGDEKDPAAGATFTGGTAGPRRIDYAFVTPELRRAVTDAWVDGRADGSDHQPLFVRLDLDRT